MRTLIQFVIRNSFIIVFVLLELISFVFVIKSNHPHHERFINSANAINATVSGWFYGWREYFHLQEMNDELVEENRILRSRMRNSFDEVNQPKKVMKDSSLRQRYFYISAQVVNNTVDRQKNYLTISKGSEDGITPNMAVISPAGVVGIVNSVSSHYATVISVLHRDCHISAKFKKNNYFGSIYWDGVDYRTVKLDEVPYHVPVQKGDVVVTNTFSNIFPTGIPIGIVQSVNKNGAESFYDITIALATNFKTVDYVYVVTDIFKNERDSLEQNITLPQQ